MIASLRGTIIQKRAGRVVLEVNGVGYDVKVPIGVLAQMPDDLQSVFLFIHTHVKENSIELYGFLTQEDKYIFEKVISVSGIGPRIGLNILSTMSADEFRRAVESSNLSKLTQTPGLGKKIAMRIVVELKEKLPTVEIPIGSVHEDVVCALINLGYKKNDVVLVVEQHYKKGVKDLENLLKESLKSLSKGGGLL
ncbi:MAG: Holliday junction branch migration protein RuvA [Candidatus Magnetoovum sp. WYHC-5]|nr:Holliday junction branch migration protein RuvA [Candidatus Magnetoovum sp. WYHC-5]